MVLIHFKCITIKENKNEKITIYGISTWNSDFM